MHPKILVILALGLVVSTARAALPAKPSLPLAVAKQVVARAEADAVNRGFTMVIVVLDDGGNLLLLERMDGTQLGSLEVAQAKARTALRFKRPTKAYEDAVGAGHTAILSVPGVIAIEGGAPLMVNGVPVGAVGVSGMKPNEDGMVLQAALAAFQDITK